jgi:hypothetical protein
MYRLHLQGKRISQASRKQNICLLGLNSTSYLFACISLLLDLMMEPVRFIETPVKFYQNTWHHSPEHWSQILRSHRREDLKSHTCLLFRHKQRILHKTMREMKAVNIHYIHYNYKEHFCTTKRLRKILNSLIRVSAFNMAQN